LRPGLVLVVEVMLFVAAGWLKQLRPLLFAPQPR
jgi:hypothetical protein